MSGMTMYTSFHHATVRIVLKRLRSHSICSLNQRQDMTAPMTGRLHITPTSATLALLTRPLQFLRRMALFGTARSSPDLTPATLNTACMEEVRHLQKLLKR